ncbi:hypothetical protein F5887DRAFT_599061 [Amanita rubescens]|nr:hypothetical protein F5887DRAFT_599061 [Amanita rubescens]
MKAITKLFSYSFLLFLLSTFVVAAPSIASSRNIPLEQAGELSGTTWEKVGRQSYLKKTLVTFVGDDMTVRGVKLSALYVHDSAPVLSISELTKSEERTKALEGMWILTSDSREDRPSLPTAMRISRNNRVGGWFIRMNTAR